MIQWRWCSFCHIVCEQRSDSPAQNRNDDAGDDEVDDEEERLSPQMQIKDGIGDFPLWIRLDDARNERDVPGPGSSIIVDDGEGGTVFQCAIVPTMTKLVRVVRPGTEDHFTPGVEEEEEEQDEEEVVY